MERRDFVKSTAVLGMAAALPRYSLARAKGNDRIKVGLIGCGGRGRGALCNMISADQNIEIVAVADLFADKPQQALDRVQKHIEKLGDSAKGILDMSKVKRFVGLNCVDEILATDIDVVIDACPPVFRTPHFEKIVAAGKHAFLEKPPCVDAVQARKMLELSKKADEKGLCVVCGTQRRYYSGYQEMVKRVQDGEIGEIVNAQCYWNSPVYVGGPGFHRNEELAWDTMEYQIRNWFSFIWTSGDNIVEQHVHNIDVIMWALGDNRFPVELRAWGGRSADADLPSPQYGDRFTHCVVDYDFGEGVRLMSSCSQERKTSGEVGERVVGSKATLVTSGGRCRFIDRKGKTIYANTQEIINPYVAEHKFLLDAIRNGRRVNTLDTLLGSNLIAIAGRMSAFSGKKFKYGWMEAKSKESLAPKEWKFEKRQVSVPVPGKYELA